MWFSLWILILIVYRQTEAKPNIQDNHSYVDYQTSMVELAKKIANISQEMVIIY